MNEQNQEGFTNDRKIFLDDNAPRVSDVEYSTNDVGLTSENISSFLQIGSELSLNRDNERSKQDLQKDLKGSKLEICLDDSENAEINLPIVSLSDDLDDGLIQRKERDVDSESNNIDSRSDDNVTTAVDNEAARTNSFVDIPHTITETRGRSWYTDTPEWMPDFTSSFLVDNEQLSNDLIRELNSPEHQTFFRDYNEPQQNDKSDIVIDRPSPPLNNFRSNLGFSFIQQKALYNLVLEVERNFSSNDTALQSHHDNRPMGILKNSWEYELDNYVDDGDDGLEELRIELKGADSISTKNVENKQFNKSIPTPRRTSKIPAVYGENSKRVSNDLQNESNPQIFRKRNDRKNDFESHSDDNSNKLSSFGSNDYGFSIQQGTLCNSPQLSSSTVCESGISFSFDDDGIKELRNELGKTDSVRIKSKLCKLDQDYAPVPATPSSYLGEDSSPQMEEAATRLREVEQKRVCGGRDGCCSTRKLRNLSLPGEGCGDVILSSCATTGTRTTMMKTSNGGSIGSTTKLFDSNRSYSLPGCGGGSRGKTESVNPATGTVVDSTTGGRGVVVFMHDDVRRKDNGGGDGVGTSFETESFRQVETTTTTNHSNSDNNHGNNSNINDNNNLIRQESSQSLITPFDDAEVTITDISGKSMKHKLTHMDDVEDTTTKRSGKSMRYQSKKRLLWYLSKTWTLMSK